ncbi:hypothetical protein P8C59_009360 [Phyllachora maydis]|uniref:Uncharacterized protein n=1 Tax=Phyllachora maydis TaxID=1825666 RepID=A0AAD9MJM7_9PEZI|nr:hypothetical protein P8C59_009360 [Phyllachora maydis]
MNLGDTCRPPTVRKTECLYTLVKVPSPQLRHLRWPHPSVAQPLYGESVLSVLMMPASHLLGSSGGGTRSRSAAAPSLFSNGGKPGVLVSPSYSAHLQQNHRSKQICQGSLSSGYRTGKVRKLILVLGSGRPLAGNLVRMGTWDVKELAGANGSIVFNQGLPYKLPGS